MGVSTPSPYALQQSTVFCWERGTIWWHCLMSLKCLQLECDPSSLLFLLTWVFSWALPRFMVLPLPLSWPLSTSFKSDCQKFKKSKLGRILLRKEIRSMFLVISNVGIVHGFLGWGYLYAIVIREICVHLIVGRDFIVKNRTFLYFFSLFVLLTIFIQEWK